MVPIHDTDVAEERWKQSEWRYFEFWEDVERRERRRKRIWISATAVLFLLLSSVPVVLEHWPKFRSQIAIRRLAHEVNLIKRASATDHFAYRIRFKGDGLLAFDVERVINCAATSGTVVRTGALVDNRELASLALLSPSTGAAFGVADPLQQFCYDPLTGSRHVAEGDDVVGGFAIIPVKDLAGSRSDRMSIMLIDGKSAEISFD